MYSVTSCRTNAKPGRPRRCSMFSTVPVMRLSMQTTSAPRPRRNSQRCEPMKPAPPVTRTRIASGGQDGTAADRVVFEAEPAHALGLPGIASVEHDGPAHQGAHPLEVQELELVPLGHERERIGAGGGLVGGVAIGDVGRQLPARVGNRDGIVRRSEEHTSELQSLAYLVCRLLLEKKKTK